MLKGNVKRPVLFLVLAIFLVSTKAQVFQGSIPVEKNIKNKHTLAEIPKGKAIEVASAQAKGTPVEALPL